MRVVHLLIPLIALVAFALATAASADTVLRGSGGRVWIEKDGRYSPPSPTRKGFTRVETSPYPEINRKYRSRRGTGHRHVAIWWSEPGPLPVHVHEYTPYYHYPHRALYHRHHHGCGH